MGLKEQIDNLLRQILIDTGVSFKRNGFILNAIRYYIRYLSGATNKDELVAMMKEEFKIISEPEIESTSETGDE